MRDPQLEGERAWSWSDEALGGVEFLRARYVTHSFAPHTHDGYALGVVECGAEAFRCRGATHVALTGGIILVNPGEIHTGQAAVASGWTYRMIYPPVELVQSAAAPCSSHGNSPGALPAFRTSVAHAPDLAARFLRLHRRAEGGIDALATASEMLHFLSSLARRFASVTAASPTPPASRAAHVAREYLEAHYAENVTLAALSAAAGLSPYHLSRMFVRTVGLPPHRYLEHVRIRRARILLASGEPISRVAAATGFADQSHLTRCFKRHTGVTPGRYLRHRKVVQDRDPARH